MLNIVLNHSAGDLDRQLLSELQQLRHIVTTDTERQSVSSFALALDILRKERTKLRLEATAVTMDASFVEYRGLEQMLKPIDAQCQW